MTRSDREGPNLFAKLTKVTDRFLDVLLQYAGAIPYDEYVRKSVQRQRPTLEAYPGCKASIAYKELANKVASWPVAKQSRGHLEFFVERLVLSKTG